MPEYYTADELRRRAGSLTASAASVELSRESKADPFRDFDVFLSHSFRDAILIIGLRNLLQKIGLTVYVDWIDDPELDRSKVSESTAGRLRHRMDHSKSLMFATSRASSASKWMPWELGYFDGRKGSDRVSLCPVETGDTGNFVGQEYLGLYKVIEKVADQHGLIGAAIHPTRKKAERLYSFGKASSSYRSVRDEYNFGRARKRFADF